MVATRPFVAGEERLVARRLAEIGVPILKTIRGAGVFEGAAQVSSTLAEQQVETIEVDLPPGAMHLMGLLRLVDRDLAVGWPGRLPERARQACEARGYRMLFLPDAHELMHGMALNFVTAAQAQIPRGASKSAHSGGSVGFRSTFQKLISSFSTRVFNSTVSSAD